LTIPEILLSTGQPIVSQPVEITARIGNEGMSPATNMATSWRPYGAFVGIVLEQLVQRLEPGQSAILYYEYTYDRAGGFATFGNLDYINLIDQSNETDNTRTLLLDIVEL